MEELGNLILILYTSLCTSRKTQTPSTLINQSLNPNLPNTDVCKDSVVETDCATLSEQTTEDITRQNQERQDT